MPARGFGPERGVDGHAAGLRTTKLVFLAAVLATAPSNVLLSTHGRAQGYFFTLDVMRMMLGIFIGVGFVAAGAVLERGKLVVAKTTAAALWAVTRGLGEGPVFRRFRSRYTCRRHHDTSRPSANKTLMSNTPRPMYIDDPAREASNGIGLHNSDLWVQQKDDP